MTYKSREIMQEETREARSFPITQLAEHFGYRLKNTGSHCYAEGNRNLVFFKKTNSYFDYYEKKGGSPIDFVMNERQCSIGDAVSYLNELSGFVPDDRDYYNGQEQNRKIQEGHGNSADSPAENRKELVLPERNDNHRRVFAYLTQTRGIDPSVVQDCLKHHLLYESKDRHNAVFVACDKDGDAKHAFIRGTMSNTGFRGDAYGSDKSYGFTPEAAGEAYSGWDRLLVFEAPIDLLSYLSLPGVSCSKPDADMIAMGMLSPEPVDRYLEEHPAIRFVSFLTDVDKWGLEFRQKQTAILEKRGYQILNNSLADEMKTVGVKDMNEYLLFLQSQNPAFCPWRKNADAEYTKGKSR